MMHVVVTSTDCTAVQHISIAKSFGRINNYTINPSQEILAIGVSNILGPFIGAFPAVSLRLQICPGF